MPTSSQDSRKTSQGRISEPAKTELANDLQRCADLRQLLTHWVSDRGYSIKQVTHSIETNSHRIIGNRHSHCLILHLFLGDSSESVEERARPSVSEAIDLAAENVFDELEKEIETLSSVTPASGTETMTQMVLQMCEKELSEAKEISESIKQATERLDHKVCFIRRLLKTAGPSE